MEERKGGGVGGRVGCSWTIGIENAHEQTHKAQKVHIQSAPYELVQKVVDALADDGHRLERRERRAGAPAAAAAAAGITAAEQRAAARAPERRAPQRVDVL